MAKIILPRINNIISERKVVIDSDLSIADSVNKKSDNFKENSAEILKKADQKYRLALEEAAKEASVGREKIIEEFKDSSASKLEKAQSEIQKIIDDSQNKSREITQNLTQLMQKKFFG